MELDKQRSDAAMKLRPEEHLLVGSWLQDGNRVYGDAVTERIKWLLKHELQQIAVDAASGGWDVLFQDAGDGRYWERIYPQSELQGGGPPSLCELSREAAQRKYLLHD
jgi:hypothetical protein